MSQYFDLSIRRIEIKKPKRDLKPVLNYRMKLIRLCCMMNIIILQMKELYGSVPRWETRSREPVWDYPS